MSKKQLRWISGLLSVLLVLFLALPAAAAEDVEPTGEELIAAQEEPTSAPYEEPSEAPVTEPTVPVTEPTTEAPHTHSFGKWMLARAASNKKNGVFKRTCTVCGKAQTKSIARVASVALKAKEKTYSGKALTTGVTVKDKAGKTLKAGRDYTVKFKNNKNVGTATAVVSGKGNYRFTVSRTFRIVPQGTKLTKALPSVTKAILRWKPVNAQADAYQVQYSTDKAFKKGAKTVRLGGKNTAYTVLTGLKADTTYFVRIRVLRTVKKSTFASGWSAAKAIKTITNIAHRIDGQLPLSKRVKESYFDDVVFIGDSVTEGLRYYEMANGVFGKAKFLSAGSLGATNALWKVSEKSVHPRWNGQKMKLEQSVPLTGAKKVYIMLGMNDLAAVGLDRAKANFDKLCSNILAAAPDVQIYVESVTPRVKTSNPGTLNNTNITKYNGMLADLCMQRGWYFVNVAETMFDSEGCLKQSYCSDPNGMGMHFSFTGCAAWADYLYTHTA